MSTDRVHALESPLLDKENIDSADDAAWDTIETYYPGSKRKLGARKAAVIVLSIVPWMLLVVLGVWHHTSMKAYKSRYYIRPDLTYSPIQDLVEYETKIFTTGHPDSPSDYAQEPSPEVDELWTGLYPSLVQLIPKDEAVKLVNKTTIYPHDEQRRYAIEIDVFHQLHCLNMVRKATRPDYYVPVAPEGEDEDHLLGRRHIMHCIDAIRQSLMCASDITVYTWQWDEEYQTHANQVKNPHTCRNFDKLRDWSVVNTNRIMFDYDYRVMNDPLDPTTWIDGYKGD